VRALVCALVLALVPVGAAAQTEDPDAVLARVRERLLYARYRDVMVDAYELLERSDLSARQRNSTLELLAHAQIADRDEAGARTTLTTLYSRDPGHRLDDPDASPPVQSAFARARQRPVTPVRVRLEHDPATATASAQAPEIVVRIAEGADAVDQLRLSFRAAGDMRYVRLEMPLGAGDVARARLPAARGGSEPYLVDYYVEALAPSLHALASVGTEAAPLQARIEPGRAGTNAPPATAPPPAETARQAEQIDPPLVPAPSEAPRDTGEGGGLFTEWWFWTGLVVIAAAVTITVIATSGPADPPPGSLGTLTLR
jgi:hypothetical protein